MNNFYLYGSLFFAVIAFIGLCFAIHFVNMAIKTLDRRIAVCDELKEWLRKPRDER